MIFMSALLVLAGVAMEAFIYNAKIATSQVDKAQAYYLAMAGINMAEYYLATTAPDNSTNASYRIGTATSSACPSSGGTAGRQESLGNGTYTICIETVSASLQTVKITSTGTCNSLSKTIQITVNYRSYLEMWLKMDERIGQVASDSSGNGNYRKFQTVPAWNSLGKITGGITFGGATKGLKFLTPRGAIKPATGAFTMAAWIYPTALPGTYGPIFAAVFAANLWGFSIYKTGGITYLNYQDGKLANSYGTSAFATGSWYHIAATYDPALTGTNRLKLYINGAAEATNNFQATIYGLPDFIQMGLDGSANIFTGTIDDARFYNRVLTSAEIGTIYGAGAGTSTTDSPAPYDYLIQVPGTFTEL